MSNNVLIIHGGGLVDPSKEVILRIAGDLWEKDVYGCIYLGRYSFMSLYDPSFWISYNCSTEEELKNVPGTFFGTCRGIDLTNPELMLTTLKCLEAWDVGTVIVCGGDGSARQCAEIRDEFMRNGINIIFAVPLTVDGINGGWSIGLDQAVREAVRQIENIVATSLETRDNGKFSVVAVELQGRNRDDILANVLQYFWRQGYVGRSCADEEVLFRVVPANYETNEEVLIGEINNSEKRTLILFSEGAKLKVSDLQKLTHRKVRTVIVGHAVQSNGMTTEEDMQRYRDWLTDVVNLIEEEPEYSYCIVNDGISRWKEPIDYYAKLNPREGQQAIMSKGLENLLKAYMA